MQSFYNPGEVATHVRLYCLEITLVLTFACAQLELTMTYVCLALVMTLCRLTAFGRDATEQMVKDAPELAPSVAVSGVSLSSSVL